MYPLPPVPLFLFCFLFLTLCVCYVQLAVVRGEKLEPVRTAESRSLPKATALMKKVALAALLERGREKEQGLKRRGRPPKAETVLLKARMDAALSAVCSCRDGRRKRASMFLELPEREINPEYYAMITKPIDLNTIGEKLAGGRYKKWAAFEADMLLLFANAKAFNDPR